MEVSGEILCIDRHDSPWVYLLLAPEETDELVTIRAKELYLLEVFNIAISELATCFPCNVNLKKKGSEVTEMEVQDTESESE